MSKFKVGDNIRCVDNRGNAHLTVGVIYTTTSIDINGLYIVNDIGINQFYYDDKFTIALKYPNPPHKHKDLIIAWANGAEIEVKCTTGVWQLRQQPAWDHGHEYRIKPTKTEKQILKEELLLKVKELEGKIKEMESE